MWSGDTERHWIHSNRTRGEPEPGGISPHAFSGPAFLLRDGCSGLFAQSLPQPMGLRRLASNVRGVPAIFDFGRPADRQLRCLVGGVSCVSPERAVLSGVSET